MHACMHVCMYIFMYIYIYMYVYIHNKGIFYHLEEDCAFSKEMLLLSKDSSIICRGITCWENMVWSQLWKTAPCFFTIRGYSIVVFNNYILEQECSMPNSCYIFWKHISPWKEGCTSFKNTLRPLEQQTWDFARDSGRIHAAISMLLRCNYISIFCYWFECIFNEWSFALWLWCIYLIAFNKNSNVHKVILKQKIVFFFRGIAWNQIISKNFWKKPNLMDS